jgi:hypothetical protein
MGRDARANARAKEAGVCAYCGQVALLTRDHVPPLMLLAEPYPKKLITVPACGRCNRGFSRNDDYTRNAVAMDLRAQENRTAAAKVPTIFRSLLRPEAARFRQSFLSGLRESTVLDAAGGPMGSVFTVDVSRIEATREHIARGLHFHFGGSPLPVDYKVFVQSKPGYDSMDHVVPSFASFYIKCSAQRHGYVGDAFSYVAASSGNAYGFLLLYEYFWWFVIAVPPGFPVPPDQAG